MNNQINKKFENFIYQYKEVKNESFIKIFAYNNFEKIILDLTDCVTNEFLQNPIFSPICMENIKFENKKFCFFNIKTISNLFNEDYDLQKTKIKCPNCKIKLNITSFCLEKGIIYIFDELNNVFGEKFQKIKIVVKKNLDWKTKTSPYYKGNLNNFKKFTLEDKNIENESDHFFNYYSKIMIPHIKINSPYVFFFFIEFQKIKKMSLKYFYSEDNKDNFYFLSNYRYIYTLDEQLFILTDAGTIFKSSKITDDEIILIRLCNFKTRVKESNLHYFKEYLYIIGGKDLNNKYLKNNWKIKISGINQLKETSIQVLSEMSTVKEKICSFLIEETEKILIFDLKNLLYFEILDLKKDECKICKINFYLDNFIEFDFGFKNINNEIIFLAKEEITLSFNIETYNIKDLELKFNFEKNILNSSLELEKDMLLALKPSDIENENIKFLICYNSNLVNYF